MSLYGEYLKERGGIDIIENDCGFVTFKVFPETGTCFVADLFIIPSYRGKGLGTEFMQEVQARARAAGCTRLVATVDPLFDDVDRSRNLFLKLDMRSIGQSTISLETFIKDIV